MRLLQRKAEDLGIAVTLITDDDKVRQLCAVTGFTVYSSVDDFKRHSTRHEYYDRPRPSARAPISSWLSAAGALVMLGVIGWIGYVMLPAATVSVTPSVRQLDIDVPITADQSISSPDVSAGEIPAHVAFAEVDGETTVSATGQRPVPNQAARGVVTFTNQTGDPVTVPASTILLAGSKVFFTAQQTYVAPTVSLGDQSLSGTGSTIVQAVQPGEEGNVPAGSITAIQGPLASTLTVINSSALTGGSNKQATYLSADDQAKAKQNLLDQLRQQALDKIHSQIQKNETFLLSPATDGDGAIEQLTFEESPEQVTTATKLHMKVLLRGLTFQGDDVNQVVAASFDRAVAQEAPGARQLNAPLVIDPPEVTDNNGANVQMRVHTTGKIMTPLDSRAIEQRARGLPPEEAQAAVASMPGVGQATVKLWPGWAKAVPSLSWRTHVAIGSPAI